MTLRTTPSPAARRSPSPTPPPNSRRATRTWTRSPRPWCRPAGRLRQDDPHPARGELLGCATGVWKLSEEVRAGTLSQADFTRSESAMIRVHDGVGRRGARDRRPRGRGDARTGQPAPPSGPRDGEVGGRDGRDGPAAGDVPDEGELPQRDRLPRRVRRVRQRRRPSPRDRREIGGRVDAGRLRPDRVAGADAGRSPARRAVLDGGLPPGRRAPGRAARGAGSAGRGRAHGHGPGRWSPTSTTPRSGTPR